MMRNVGQNDQIIRLVLAVVLFTFFFVISGPLRYAGLIGTILLFTGLSGICPLYWLMKINTCERKK